MLVPRQNKHASNAANEDVHVQWGWHLFNTAQCKLKKVIEIYFGINIVGSFQFSIRQIKMLHFLHSSEILNLIWPARCIHKLFFFFCQQLWSSLVHKQLFRKSRTTPTTLITLHSLRRVEQISTFTVPHVCIYIYIYTQHQNLLN